jgi:hypothetical protein
MTSNKYWISDIINNSEKKNLQSIYIAKRLNEIILPGTDNSCSTKFINELDDIEHIYFPFGFTKFVDYNKLYKSKWYLTQTYKIETLLEKGIRYFHFRISWFNNEWFISNKYRHHKLNDILVKIKDYLKKMITDNDKNVDFVYLDFELDPNHYKDNNDTSPTTQQIKKFYETLKEKFRFIDDAPNVSNDPSNFPHKVTENSVKVRTLKDYIYIPEEGEYPDADWDTNKWHKHWEIQGQQNKLFEYDRTQDGTKTIYDHLLRRETLVDKHLTGYTRGVIKLPTLGKVFGKAVIFVDEKLYNFNGGTTTEKENYKIIKPFPSFLLKNNSLDMKLVIDETPYQIHNANQQWLYHTKSKTNIIPLKYDTKNYKFINSMFNKLQLSHSISDRFYETKSNCKELNKSTIKHGRKSNWDDRKICKKQSFATRTSINMIYLKAIIKILLWAIPILQILSFFNPVGGPYWGLYITIYERDSKFFIIIVALVFFVIVTFISRLYKYFVECIPNLDQENNEDIASNLIGKFDELSTRFHWNIKQTSIISVNYPTDDIITKIIKLNQTELGGFEMNIFNEDSNNKKKVNIYTIETIDDATTGTWTPDTLKIKLSDVGKTNADGSILFAGKLRFYISSTTSPRSGDYTKFLVDQDNLIINENNTKKETLGIETYTFTHTINLRRLEEGDFQIRLWIEDEYGEELGTKTITNKWTNGVKQSQSLKITKNDKGNPNQEWIEPFKNITQISSNSSQRLKQFYESRLF